MEDERVNFPGTERANASIVLSYLYTANRDSNQTGSIKPDSLHMFHFFHSFIYDQWELMTI